MTTYLILIMLRLQAGINQGPSYFCEAYVLQIFNLMKLFNDY